MATGGNDKTVKIWKVKITGHEDEAEQTLSSETEVAPSSSSTTSPITDVPKFTLDIGGAPAAETDKTSKTTKIADWSVDQVCDWLSNTLELQVR